MSETKVAVVIATHNRLELLKQATASVLAQSFQDWELIVVDDASDDGTWPWLLLHASARIRVFRQPAPTERSAARNRGLFAAKARAVLFLDDDDLLAPAALERLWRGLADHPGAVMTIGAREAFDDLNRNLVSHPSRPSIRDIHKAIFLWWRAGQGQFLLLREVAIRVGGYDATLNHGEDQDLLLKTTCFGPAVILPAIVLHQRIHGQSRQDPVIGAMAEDDSRRRFVDALPSDQRARYRRLIRSRQKWREAEMRRDLGDDLGAARCLLAAACTCPLWLGSPFLRPQYLSEMRNAVYHYVPKPIQRLWKVVKPTLSLLIDIGDRLATLMAKSSYKHLSP